MNEYIFDKRKLKKLFTKYGLIFLAAFPLLLVLNAVLFGVVPNTWRLVILVLVGVTFVLACELAIHQFKKRKEEAHEQDIVTIKAGALGKKSKTYVGKPKVTKENKEPNNQTKNQQEKE